MKRIAFTCALITGFAAATAAPLRAQTAPERFRGNVVDTKGALPLRTAEFFTLHVDEYSTDQELLKLVALLKEKGQDAVQDALQDMEEKGWIQIGNSLGYHAAVIRTFTTEEGRVIRVFTDRPIMFFESMRGSRSRDYPFGIIELKLDKEGKGQGMLIAAASADFSEEGALEIESFGTEPFRIMNVKAKKVKTKE
jgi:hypothetical protein